MDLWGRGIIWTEFFSDVSGNDDDSYYSQKMISLPRICHHLRSLLGNVIAIDYVSRTYVRGMELYLRMSILSRFGCDRC